MEDAYLLFANEPLIQRVDFNGSNLQVLISEARSGFVGLAIDIRLAVFQLWLAYITLVCINAEEVSCIPPIIIEGP